LKPNTLLIPTAEPFFFPGDRSKPGILLIHGFTGTPKEMRTMGEYLAGQGFNVLGVRLAGHATRPQDMIRTSYQDWMASVEDGYQYLNALSSGVYLAGLSMGGVLSLLMSTKLDVRGVVAMSTPDSLPKDYPLWLIRLVALFRPLLSKSNSPPGTGWFDQEVWKDHVSYPRNPTRSVGELKQLLGEMRAALPKVDVPVFLIHSRDDGYILPENMDRIHAALSARDKETLWVTGSGHVVTRDAARRQVFEAVLRFIRRVESEP
jgi:carboxylesterase